MNACGRMLVEVSDFLESTFNLKRIKEAGIIFLVGDTRSREMVKLLEKLKWGRMMIDRTFVPYEGEPWGFDNGAYRDWKNGKKFDENRFLNALEKAVSLSERYHAPYLAVLPDIVAGGKQSLELSLCWLEKLKDVPFPWYLPVQDGMSVAEIEEILGRYREIRGIFLGGSDRFKGIAPLWGSLAGRLKKRFHYARAGTKKKILHARLSGATSADSAFPLWVKERFYRFLQGFLSISCYMLYYIV